MPMHKVMDSTGHSEKAWEQSDVVSVADAEKRFKELTGRGFLAVEPGKNGDPGRVLKSFDPNVETTIFQPALQGG